MHFIRKPGSDKYEKAAIEFVGIFSGVSNQIGNDVSESDIDQLFAIIDIPKDKIDVFVGIVASFHMDKSPGLLIMKQIASKHRARESDHEIIEFIKSLKNKELKDIMDHSLNTLKLLDQMVSIVDESLLVEPMFLYSSFVKYITLLKKINFGKTKKVDPLKRPTVKRVTFEEI